MCCVATALALPAFRTYRRQEDSKLNEPQQMIKLFQRMMSVGGGHACMHSSAHEGHGGEGHAL